MNLEEATTFVTGGVSIALGSRSAELVPSLCRAKGCRVISRAPLRLRILVSAMQAGEVVEDVRSSGVAAATFSDVISLRTVQFKGSDAVVEAATPEDYAVMNAYTDAFAVSIGKIGFSAEYTRALLVSPPDLVAIELTSTGAFKQTPGPGAGGKL